jgi:hypothetical protein
MLNVFDWPQKVALTVGLVSLGLGCSRPTYEVMAYDVKSTCDGGVDIKVLHDTDPRENRAEIAEASRNSPDAAKIVALHSQDPYLKIVFASGVVCSFLEGETVAECTETATSTRAAACDATREATRLAPSHDDGFPHGK